MKIPIWVHSVETAYPGGGGLPADDTQNPFSAVYGKTNDGLRFQATWDGHRLAVGSINDVARADRDIYGAQGLGYVPWGVVHGRWEGQAGYAAREGRLAGQIARAAAQSGETPVYIVDLEPYYHAPFPAFWRGDLGANASDVADFVDAFDETVPGGEVWLAVDARDPFLRDVSFEAWIARPSVGPVLPMVYFTDFVRPRTATVRDAGDAIGNAIAALGRFSVAAATIDPIFPGDAEPPVMAYAIETAAKRGCGGVSIWQRANLRGDTAEAIAAMVDPWGDRSAPALDREAIRAKLDLIENEIPNIAGELDIVRDAIGGIEEALGRARGTVTDIRDYLREE